MLAVQRFITSAAALDPGLGPTEACIEEAEVKLAFAGVAAEVIVAVDGSKLGTRALAATVGWDEIDLLVTDLDPKDRRLAPYRDLVEIA
jgi:DeoR family fructose operon transcriptional repressor